MTGVSSTGPSGPSVSVFGYDAAGNTTTRTIGGGPAQTLTWDVEGELVSVATGGASDSYVYTADGDRLVRHQGGVTTVYLPGGLELTRDVAGTVTATRYYAFAGQVVGVRTGAGNANVTNLVTDRHGTPLVAIGATTSVVTRRYTHPYGNLRGTVPTGWVGDHGFLDKPVDGTGLVQVGARYYDPVIARFISVDPLLDLTDPQQWHGYSYANNNPQHLDRPHRAGTVDRRDVVAGAARAGHAGPRAAASATPGTRCTRIALTCVGIKQPQPSQRSAPTRLAASSDPGQIAFNRAWAREQTDAAMRNQPAWVQSVHKFFTRVVEPATPLLLAAQGAAMAVPPARAPGTLTHNTTSGPKVLNAPSRVSPWAGPTMSRLARGSAARIGDSRSQAASAT